MNLNRKENVQNFIFFFFVLAENVEIEIFFKSFKILEDFHLNLRSTIEYLMEFY